MAILILDQLSVESDFVIHLEALNVPKIAESASDSVATVSLDIQVKPDRPWWDLKMFLA